MAGPGAPSVSPSASTSTSATVAKEMAFPLPPQTLQSAERKLASKAPAAPGTNAPPSEQVLVPPRGTLAAGRYEARPATIWFVVAMGTLVVLSWALLRLRRVRVERRKKLEALTTLKKPSV